MRDEEILSELHRSVEALAKAMADRPLVSRALERFAERLPSTRAGLERSVARRERRRDMKPLLWRALAEGVLDGRSFDRGMLIENRANRPAAGGGRG